jgi:hypothetical protein
MHPTIRDGDIITVEPVMPSAVKQGDIILYRSGTSVTAHRVVRISQTNDGVLSFILRGDALGSPVEQVAAQQIMGKIVRLKRNGQRIDPYSWRSMVYFTTRFFVSRLRRQFAPKILFCLLYHW